MTAGGNTPDAAGPGGGPTAHGEVKEAVPVAPYLADVAPPVRDQLAASVELGDFLRDAGTLTLAERRLLVEQALVLIEQNYVHLPLKAAMHAVNPVQRLRLLRARLERQTAATMPPEWLFHAELSEIFHSVRDLHTNYLLPQPFNGKIAYLPFEIEEYFDDQEPRYAVTRVVQGFTAPGFGPGAEVTHWSGIPIARAVDLNAARFAGSNEAARHSRGVQSLTIRPLRIHLPPNEEWVTVSYLGLDGVERELRERWLVADNLPPFVDTDAVSVTAPAMGLDLDADETSRAKKLLYVPQRGRDGRAGRRQGTGRPRGRAGRANSRRGGPDHHARRLPGPQRRDAVGHVRSHPDLHVQRDDPVAFVDEFVRLIGLLPADGLIVDVRDNGGGHIYASEFTLQTLTPRRIAPEPVQFVPPR